MKFYRKHDEDNNFPEKLQMSYSQGLVQKLLKTAVSKFFLPPTEEPSKALFRNFNSTTTVEAIPQQIVYDSPSRGSNLSMEIT